MLDLILDRPGNRAVYESLIGYLRGKEAIAFVGAGASAGLYPLWPELIERLADVAVAQGRATEKDAARWKSDTSSSPQARVDAIVRKLGETALRNFLRETFGPRSGADAKQYTPTHAALLRLPFRGYVTTNFDLALDFARAAIRAGTPSTGTPTWEDADIVHSWLTGDVFKPPNACPILWLHGSYQRAGGIVLNGGTYATAYRPGLYRHTFHRLWAQDHLVFVGFGFNDPQFTFMAGEILRDFTAPGGSTPRHIAIVGLPADDFDPDALQDRRIAFESQYGVRPLFYAIGPRHDHAELLDLLGAAAAEAGSATSAAPIAQLSPAPASGRIEWVHSATDDIQFRGREDQCARLDRWVRDVSVRAIAATAIGGAGKTALIGHWLKATASWHSRPFEGLFAWSFYQEAETSMFLERFVTWAQATFGGTATARDIIGQAIEVLTKHPTVIVLDGLEVQQEGLNEERHGTFLDPMLREFLTILCARTHGSLAVLTSRFVFPDLERFLGGSFRQLDLTGLTGTDGAALLASLGIAGTDADRSSISAELDGHPLALRLFAEAIPDRNITTPVAFLREAFDPAAITPDTPLAKKVRRLLAFYERRLPPEQVKLLSIVALFRSPVRESVIVRLMSGLFNINSQSALRSGLLKLQSRGILMLDAIGSSHGYSCHPILRSYFRASFIGAGEATIRRTADLLTGSSANEVLTLESIEPILIAIELLLDTDEYEAADALYRERLDNGRAFRTLDAYREGFRCALSFVRDPDRFLQHLDRVRLGYYYNEVGLHAHAAGEHDIAADAYARADVIDREAGLSRNRAISLLNLAMLSSSRGRLADAARYIDVALYVPRIDEDSELLLAAHVALARVQTLSGDVKSAVMEFAIAERLQGFVDILHGRTRGDRLLHGAAAGYRAELLLRCGRDAEAEAYCHANRFDADDSPAENVRFLLLLAWLALRSADIATARNHLQTAEATLRRADLLAAILQHRLLNAQLALAERNTTLAHEHAREALSIAQSREARPFHADALIVRGMAYADEGDSQRNEDSLLSALDDADDAIRIARDCNYAWAHRDALLLKNRVYSTMTARSQNVRYQEAADLARDQAALFATTLALSDSDIVAARESSFAWLRELERKKRQ